MNKSTLLCGFMAAILLALCQPAASKSLRGDVRQWRQANEKAVVGELSDLLSIRNVAANPGDIERNAAFVRNMLAKRGFATRILSAVPGTPQAVFGELKTPGAKRTVVFYAHMDGQPAVAKDWMSGPWEPTIRRGPPQDKAPAVDWRSHLGPFDPEWRIYARSASDDKGSIGAFMAAFDAVRASGRKPSINIKILIEGEEEDGSPHLRTILAQNRELLTADAWFLCDGPIHQSGRMQAIFGVRGVIGLDLTVYGPTRPLHSGHFGNWAPNPAAMMARLVAEMRDDNGRILIPGFYDDVRPLTPDEKAALAKVPSADEQLRTELGLAATERPGRLLEATTDPALNVVGLAAGGVGSNANNAIATQAQTAFDLRLVPDQDPEKLKRYMEAFLQSRGWHLVDRDPDAATRMKHPKIAKLTWSSGYGGHRTDIALPVSKAAIRALERASGGATIVVPFLGGSVPVSLFAETLNVPVVIAPIVNHDNNQHGANENLRLQNLWDGIEAYAGLIADLDW